MNFIMGLLFILIVPCMMIYSFKEINIYAGFMYASLFTVAGYTIPIMIYSQQYIDCINNEFPMQNVGFVSYVFGAITTIYSLCMFFVTLINRIGTNNISPLISTGIFVVPVIGAFTAAILMQEVVIPFVSTQRLIMYVICIIFTYIFTKYIYIYNLHDIYRFCPRPQHLSYEDYIESVFNVSALAQNTLQLTGYDTFTYHASEAM